MADLYIPGKFYTVPTVEGTVSGEYVGTWVIMGPWHEDADHLDFPAHHYHLHPQFAPQWMVDMKKGGVSMVFALLVLKYGVMRSPLRGCYVDEDDQYELGPVVMRRRKCLRKMPPHPHKRSPWMKRLTAAYSGQRINLDKPVCPHRGADLSRVPKRSGCITCPLHGLRFDAKTGRVQELSGLPPAGAPA